VWVALEGKIANVDVDGGKRREGSSSVEAVVRKAA